MQNKLAKSRLKQKDESGPKYVPTLDKKFPPVKSTTLNKTNGASTHTTRNEQAEKTYRTALPSLFIGIGFLLVVAILIATVQPHTIAHIPLQNSFFPFLTPLFLGVFFVTSYIFLNSQRGFFAACFVTCIIWTQLVLPNLTLFVGLGLLAWYGILAFLLQKKT